MMLSIFLYLTGILDPDEKRTLKIYCVLSALTLLLGLFGVSMVFPIVNQAVNVVQIPKETLLMMLVMAGLTIISGGIELYKSRVLNRLIYGGAQHFSEKLYEVLIKEDLLKHNERDAVGSITAIRGDSLECMNLLVANIDIVCSGAVMAGLSVILIAVTGGLGLISFFCIMFYMFTVYYYYKINMYRYGEKKRNFEIRLNAQITVTYGVFKELKLDERWKTVMKRYKNYSRKFAEAQEQYSFKKTVVNIFLNNSIQAVFCVLFVLSVIFEIDLISLLGEIAVFVTVLTRMLSVGTRIVSGLHSLEFGKKAYDALYAGMEECDRIREIEEKEKQQRMKEITLKKSLQIKNVTFAYREGENIFEDASADLVIGKSTAVVGPSGIGKSTFLDLVLGLLKPQKGNIYYDDYDIVTKSDNLGKCRGTLGHIVSYIPQVIYLNGETVRNNVAFFDENIDDARVREVLAIAHVLEDVEKLPEGIHSLIGECGCVLSGGQRQRIALARALYRDFELLVMDEAMASLDVETEKAVIDSIRNVKKNKTILLVTHHANLAEECDVIYRIENKKLVRVK